MIEIENSSSKRLTFDEIKEKYSLKDKLAYELEDMLHLGFISKDFQGFYINTSRGKRYSRFVKFMRDFLRLGYSGGKKI